MSAKPILVCLRSCFWRLPELAWLLLRLALARAVATRLIVAVVAVVPGLAHILAPMS